MHTFLKALAGIVAAFALILGAFTLYLMTVFDPNDYKADIQALVKQHSQLDLKIEGDLSLSVFPWLGVSIGKFEINTPQGPLASAESTQLFAKLRPLLNGKLEIDGITLKGLQLKLLVNKNGKSNWHIDTPATASDPKTRQETGEQSTAETVSPLALPLGALSIGNISIEQAGIDYRNLQTNQHHQINNLDLRVGKPSLDLPFPINGNFKYTNTELNQAIPFHITAMLNMAIPDESFHINDLVVDINSTRLIGQASVLKLLKDPQLNSQFRIDGLQLNQWSEILNKPELTDLTLPIDINVALALDTEKDQLAINTLNLKAANLLAKGSLSVNQFSEASSYTGQLTVEPFDLQKLLIKTGREVLPTNDHKTLKHLAAKLIFSGDQSALNLSSIDLEVDDTKVNGWLSVKHSAKPAYSYNLGVTTLDLDKYLPARTQPAAGKSTTTNQPTISAQEALLLPVAAMRDLNIEGSIQFKKLIASGLIIENISARTSASNGFIRLQNITGELYDGTFKANGTIDARGSSPQITIKKQLRQMNAGPVLAALSDIDFITGKLDLDVTGTTFGDTEEKLTNNLNADIQFSVADGLLKTISLEQMVCDGIARIRQLAPKAPPENPATLFKQFSGHMNISNGLIHNDQLVIRTDSLSARGGGTINLRDQTLNFGLDTKVRGELDNKSCEVNERYRDIEWPVICQGLWDAEPSEMCTLDRKKMNKIIGRLVEQELQLNTNKKLEDIINENLGGELGEQLKNLLKFQ
jgi:AsmA protein